MTGSTIFYGVLIVAMAILIGALLFIAADVMGWMDESDEHENTDDCRG